ncbi:MAG: tetratricopeptide repeat protein [Acidobacteriota bacterium]
MIKKMLLAMALCCAAIPAGADRDLGEIDFPTSGGAEAQAHFERGVLWLHSFEYDDARAEFRRALEIEPGFFMAVWGEAMTYNYPVWAQQNPEEGRQALSRLGQSSRARLAKAPTTREGAYLAAVEALFGEGSKQERDLLYADAMERLAAAHPEDLEAASFYALAILGTADGDRDYSIYMRAGAVVEEVYAANPRHPGALHYLIHSYDDPIHAPLGLRAARRYAEVAPSAAHALHMPSHIFFALGDWQASEASNVDSFDAAAARDRRNDHALFWWHYSLLQQGRFQEAAERLTFLVAALAEASDARGRRHLAYMRAGHGIETGDWPSLPGDLDPADLPAAALATEAFALGYRALEAGDLAAAEGALAELRGMAGELAAGDAEALMAGQLEALLLHRRGKSDRALEVLRAVADAEDARSYDIGPPVPVKPSRELLGELLLDAGQADAARRELELALERQPNRSSVLRGLLRAACAGGDGAERDAWSRRLAANYVAADMAVKSRSGCSPAS